MFCGNQLIFSIFFFDSYKSIFTFEGTKARNISVIQLWYINFDISCAMFCKSSLRKGICCLNYIFADFICFYSESIRSQGNQFLIRNMIPLPGRICKIVAVKRLILIIRAQIRNIYFFWCKTGCSKYREISFLSGIWFHCQAGFVKSLL